MKIKTKKPIRTGTESQKWRSHGELPAGKGGGEWGKGTGHEQHKWWEQNRQGEVKNSLGNGEAKDLICTTHGHELRWRNAGGRGVPGRRGIKGRK